MATLTEMNESVRNHKGPIILDSGCGTGDSTKQIASLLPNALVLGIDKNASRLRRARHGNQVPNAYFFQVLLEDCWLYAFANTWTIDTHFLLYPNPWPKKKHIRRRWYAHPVFQTLLLLSPYLEIRTNWNIYAQDFVSSVSAMASRSVSLETFHPTSPLTAFEKKYAASGHTTYKISVYSEIKRQTTDILRSIA